MGNPALYPTESLYPSEDLYPSDGSRSVIVNHQFEDDDRHTVIIRAADGTPVARWAEDEHLAENVVDDLALSGGIPGGKKDASGSLPRDPRQDWPDLQGFLNFEVQQPGRQRIWDGRIGKSPRTNGDRVVITGQAVGWAAALEDRKALKLGFIDTDLSSRIGSIPAQRRDDLQGEGVDPDAVSTSIDPFGSGEAGNKPAGLTFTYSALKKEIEERGEQLYDSGGIDIEAVLFDFEGRTSPQDTDFFHRVDLSRDGVTSSEPGTDLNAVSLSEQSTTSSLERLRYAIFTSAYKNAGVENDPWVEAYRFARIAVLAATGLVPQGSWPDIYLTAKQILTYAVPLYSLLRVTDDSIEDDEVPITQAWYPDRGTLAPIVDDVLKGGLMDWFVKDARLLEVRRPGTYGRKWQASQGAANFEEVAIDTDRCWDRIVVDYQDVDGSTKSVGYPGSGADVETDQLLITDPEHPAVKAGTPREDLLTLGISTAERAQEIGERWLQEANELSRSGKAELVSHAMDSAGVFRPVGQVAEGDLLRFPDARDTSYRRVVSYAYDPGNKKTVVNLDAPSESVKALLEQFRAVLTPLGLAR